MIYGRAGAVMVALGSLLYVTAGFVGPGTPEWGGDPAGRSLGSTISVASDSTIWDCPINLARLASNAPYPVSDLIGTGGSAASPTPDRLPDDGSGPAP